MRVDASQKPRSCRAQELARSCAQENARQKKCGLLKFSDNRVSQGKASESSQKAKKKQRSTSQARLQSVEVLIFLNISTYAASMLNCSAPRM